ncbi:nucleoside diphosphate-linked moiety x motif 17 [Stylonychia lemnae]|uniref:Nucleoside diphosphate-linked moiety x motif 17 n=1 Tax=Stylonychia lemnae TaxID=5949 RepID=A0A078A2V8_STYLE|nr:nucleoside diphosphate-linked moiety x motif 17 [Stylonychia lemnae]|eukprot:CDW76450.1 nucleoside diphosphate-linked moiety x motif 17 [Stylonychia lemnae]
MSVCSVVMDKNNHVLLTKRPSNLNSFPKAWVLPGGIVDFQESFEWANIRELQEETGLDYQLIRKYKRFGTGDQVHEQKLNEWIPQAYPRIQGFDVELFPFYLYESVTKNISDPVDPSLQVFPPKYSHLIMMFMNKISANYQEIKLKFNRDEVEDAAWVSLDILKNVFAGKNQNIEVMKVDQNLNQENNFTIQQKQTDVFYPLYRYNHHSEGLGKGHYLGLKYLINIIESNQIQNIKLDQQIRPCIDYLDEKNSIQFKLDKSFSKSE